VIDIVQSLPARAAWIEIPPIKIPMAQGSQYHVNARDKDRVQCMAEGGVPETRIAEILDMAPKTLRKYYGKLIKDCLDETVGKIGHSIVQRALDLNCRDGASCAMFYLKTRGNKYGWSEKIGFDDAAASLIKRVIGVKDDEI
jgi:hypothetical protein